jgi:hypothetical protein
MPSRSTISGFWVRVTWSVVSPSMPIEVTATFFCSSGNRAKTYFKHSVLPVFFCNPTIDRLSYFNISLIKGTSATSHPLHNGDGANSITIASSGNLIYQPFRLALRS